MRELPRDISGFELQAFFTFSPAERALIEARRGDSHNLGLALHIGFLRMTGRLLDAFRIVRARAWRHLGTQLFDLFKNGAWSFATQLLQPIFDAGRNRANLAVAQVQRDIAVAQYERAIQAAFRDVADALAGRATLDEQLRATQAQARAEQARYSLSDLRFRNGVSSSLELLDAERSLFAAQQAVVQTQLALLQNRVSTYRALGGGTLGTAGQ